MDIGKFSYYSRKVHRLSLLFVIVLGLIQMITGLLMKYPDWLPLVDQTDIRVLHYQTATWFALVFGLQMLSGIIMYLSPWLIKILHKSPTPPNLPG